MSDNLTPEQLTFKRLQTDAPDTVSVFVAVDGVLADGTPITGSWESITITLTPEEAAAALAIVNRAKQEFCDRQNGG